MKQYVLDHPEDENGLRQYYKAAIDAGDIDHARITFDQLQEQYQSDHCIRRLLISVCLHQKDYHAAMAEIETLVAFSVPDEPLIESALKVRTQLGPRSIDEGDPAGPTLSVCMIVKNEQSYLGPCLNSVKSMADEIIVVDTGSTDHSIDLARIYGAHVFHFQWCNDFSAARNYALEKATGEWILVLDADEVIATQDHSIVRGLMAEYRDQPVALSFKTRNYAHAANGLNWQVNNGSYSKYETGLGWFPSNKVRLFQRSKEIRFNYPIHELVEPAIKRAGIEIFQCQIPIHHYGNLNESRNKEKAQQYFELGYEKVEQLGDDLAALRELAIQAGQVERWQESILLWQRYLSIGHDDGEAYANIAGAYWQLGQYDLGTKFAKKAVRIDPALREGHYNLAANLLLTGQPDEAATILQKMLSAYQDYLSAQFLLAAVYLIIGKEELSQSLLKSLTDRLTIEGLKVALETLSLKLRESGHDAYACTLAQVILTTPELEGAEGDTGMNGQL